MTEKTKKTELPLKKEDKKGGADFFAGIAIVASMIVGFLVWKFIMGDPSNFIDNNPHNQPLEGNFLGIIYKGGYVVPVLLGLFLMTIVFAIERFFMIRKASGKGNVDVFVREVQSKIVRGDIEAAIQACDKQEGSVANTIKAALIKYEELKAEGVGSEKATESLQKEIEEATALEMPILEKNMVIISTLVSIGTLIGLLGTVMGMITAFAALATSGAPDQAELANGISEALINTATGIATSTLAVIAYNAFTSKIDKLTYSIDEAGYVITQTYRRFKGGNLA